MWDPDAGYDRDDPKHPDFADAAAHKADMDRKRMKEDEHYAEYMREKEHEPRSDESKP